MPGKLPAKLKEIIWIHGISCTSDCADIQVHSCYGARCRWSGWEKRPAL